MMSRRLKYPKRRYFKIMSSRTMKVKNVINYVILFLFVVPEKVWNIQDVEKINPEVLNLNKKQNEEDLWWNQAGLTHLDLSSNVLTDISSSIKNLLDLTVLNVSS